MVFVGCVKLVLRIWAMHFVIVVGKQIFTRRKKRQREKREEELKGVKMMTMKE